MDKNPGVSRFLESVIDVGFVGIASLCGVLFFLEGQQWVELSSPMKVLVLAAWCPFFWGEFWVAKANDRRVAPVFFLCAAVITAVTILAALVVIIKLAA